MAIRNWWIQTMIDGKGTKSTGPTRREDGFSLNVFQREGGESVLAVKIEGFVERQGGQLRLEIRDSEGKRIAEDVVTSR